MPAAPESLLEIVQIPELSHRPPTLDSVQCKGGEAVDTDPDSRGLL